MTTQSRVQFQPKWKELLVCTMDGTSFFLELTMGTVYFPTETKWKASSPEWARHQWERVRQDLTSWCEEKISLIIEDNAWVEFK